MHLRVSRKNGFYLGIFAFVAANLILVLTLSGKSPDLHALLHDSQKAEAPCDEEACVIDLFAGGQVLGPDPVIFSQPTLPERKEPLPPMAAFSHYLRDYLLAPGRSPPATRVDQ